MNLTEAIEATRRFVQVQEKATPGPWEAGGCLHGNTHRWFPFDEGHELFPPLVDCGPQPGGPVAMVSDGEYENTPLIADARNYPAPEVLKLLERLEWSVSYGEIEAACGGELAQQVWQAVLSRREKIHEELEERQ